jgi:tRNA (guanine26-N2/guanine27-N2)-dimethyltransferase
LQDSPTTGEAFDVIDLDPFGSAVPFLDAAINSNNDTLLCITFTDSRVLCGQDVTKCFYSYGASRSRQVQAYQENAIRIAMQTINTTANRYGKYVEPYLCYQSEFYLRCFVRVRDGKERCWRSYAYTGNVYHCDNCTNYHIHPLGRSKPESKTNRPLYRINPLQQLQSAHCEQCGSLFNVNGPVWLGPLINRDFVNRLIAHLETPDFELHLKTRDRILGMLKGMSEEAALFHRPPEASDLDAEGLAEPSLYGFSTAHIGGLLRYSAISKKELFSALHSLGYKLFQSFQNPQIFKTDAPLSVIFDLHRLHKAWKLGADNYLKKVKEGSVAHLLLTKASTL